MPVPYEILNKCINAARLAPSAANLQALEYIVVDEEQLLDNVFGTLKWANYISPSGNPPPGERPRAYIVVLTNRNVSADGFEYDVGLAVGTIIIVALEEGLGTCCIGSIDRAKLMEILKVPSDYTIALVVALGYPNESPIEEEFEGSIKYWKDESNVLHVPKRKLGDILHRNSFASS
jgi:nitroreductase